jgi:hypothetical protein
MLAIITLVCFDLELGFLEELSLYFGTMFLICMVCHGELVKLRPTQREHITEYYLLISLGGALGGLFITLFATRYFDEYYEWPLGLLLSFVIAASVLGSIAIQKRWLGALSLWLVGVGIVLSTVFVAFHLDPFSWGSSDEDFGIKQKTLLQARNFYGTVSVTDREYTRRIEAKDNDGIVRDLDSGYRSFFSGSILHGRQWTDSKKRNLPLTYYDKDSGVGKTLNYCIERTHRDRPIKFGVVGLGSGALAAYARPADGSRLADECVMYEINPLVEQIAREYFWYLPDYEQRLGKPIEVRLGDARLTMEREAPQEYDVIVLDAFSGDSVPAHLLTREAFDIYRKHLKKNADGSIAGMICIHITNTYLNLYPVVKNAAQQVLQMKYTSVYKTINRQDLLMRSHYFIMSNDQEFLDQTPMVPPYTTESSPDGTELSRTIVEQDWPGIPLWTDHHSTIFNLLWNQ